MPIGDGVSVIGIVTGTATGRPDAYNANSIIRAAAIMSSITLPFSSTKKIFAADIELYAEIGTQREHTLPTRSWLALNSPAAWPACFRPCVERYDVYPHLRQHVGQRISCQTMRIVRYQLEAIFTDALHRRGA